MKWCPKCQAHKPREEFYLTKDGTLSGYCKPCTKADVHRWIRENPERFKRNQRRSVLKRKYGLTEDDVAEMLATQQGKCPICRTVITAGNLNVDHDHDTGRVRGILCDRCNRTIGLLRDDPAIARAAATYLKRRRTAEGAMF